jgi:hypothetical protein
MKLKIKYEMGIIMRLGELFSEVILGVSTLLGVPDVPQVEDVPQIIVHHPDTKFKYEITNIFEKEITGTIIGKGTPDNAGIFLIQDGTLPYMKIGDKIEVTFNEGVADDIENVKVIYSYPIEEPKTVKTEDMVKAEDGSWVPKSFYEGE